MSAASSSRAGSSVSSSGPRRRSSTRSRPASRPRPGRSRSPHGRCGLRGRRAGVDTAAGKSRRLGVERGDRLLELVVLALQGVDLVEELAPSLAGLGRCRPPHAARAAAAGRRGRSGGSSHRPGRRTATPVGRRTTRRRARCARPSARGSRRPLGIRSGRTCQPTRSQPRRGRWLPSWASSRLR